MTDKDDLVDTIITGYEFRISELERENAALRADKERLDWLEQSDMNGLEPPSFFPDKRWCIWFDDETRARGGTVREAIDAARK